MKNNNKGERIAVLTSHFTRSTPMASEKEAALAATPPDTDSPTMYASIFSSTLIFTFLFYFSFLFHVLIIWVFVC
jgi:hypothetical protein